MARTPEFRASEILADSTFKIEVRLIHDWRFRFGLWLVRIGVRVMGCNVEVKEV